MSPELPPASEQPPQSAPAEDNPLQRALESQKHAEALQAQHAHRQQLGLQEPELSAEDRQAVDRHVDSIEGLSDWKRRFLKSHPSLLTEPYSHLMKHAYMLAMHSGIEDDSPRMDQVILQGVIRDLEHHRALASLTSADARSTPENAAAHQDVAQHAADLQSEAEEHMAAFTAENPPPPPPAPRKSFPISAPVAREAPMSSGQRQPSNNTLTAEERQIARNSFTDPNMSNEQKELLYLRNRQKLHSMRANGTYSEERG